MKAYILLGIILCFSITIFAQSKNSVATIHFNSKQLKLTEAFVISVVITDSDKRPSIVFPDIAELEKRSKSATSEVRMVDGKRIVMQTISQEYFASKVGKYLIPEFSLMVNNEDIISHETTIFFSDTGNADPVETTELNITEQNNDEVFFSVAVNNTSVYIREGFSLSISLFISEAAPVEMEFYQFNAQFQEILKKIRPAGCWEENTGIEEIVKRKVTIRGQAYTEYNMFKATFFPLKLEDIWFPSVGLSMLVVDRMGAVNVQKKVIKTFYNRPFKVQVKPLPPHPLRDQVSVGVFSLVEKLTSETVFPGESVRYNYIIRGKGNIVNIPAPEIIPNSAFDFYTPEISHVVTRNSSGVSGEKAFDYIVVPRNDGKFPLDRYFQWVFFDPVKAVYDTLHSDKILEVRGEDYKLGNLSLSHSLGIYDNLENLVTTKTTINYREILKNLTNVIAIVLLLLTVWIFRKH